MPVNLLKVKSSAPGAGETELNLDAMTLDAREGVQSRIDSGELTVLSGPARIAPARFVAKAESDSDLRRAANPNGPGVLPERTVPVTLAEPDRPSVG